MATGNCTNEDQYPSKTGGCCGRCDAGSYVEAECDGNQPTKCAKCEHGFYTATKNHMKSCHLCRVCSSNSNQRTLKECSPQEDTVCTCTTGFYCSNHKCEHCQPVLHCPPGEGVTSLASHTNNTVCAPCKDGTYSNMTDFSSPCRQHTRCEDFGRELSIPGTSGRDAVCGGYKSQCHWALPAGLWAGLVVTALILFGLFCWRLKRKSSRSVFSPIVPVTMVDVIPAGPDSLLKDYRPQICAVDGCELPVYSADHYMVHGCAADSQDSCQSITALKTSHFSTESSHGNGITGHCTGNFHRSISEPQEDEWCGT
ncbi:tumor necrosis factor receptor superfamily member 5 [Takifugu flavidus]|nr:tumor necrosis factor receptor superfamily member 5 [Takifugu flavidus]